MFALRKGRPTAYPVPVVRWRTKRGLGRVPPDWTTEQVLSATERVSLVAVPVDPTRLMSTWQTIPPARIASLERMRGQNAYRARLGAYTAPYGVFRLRVIEPRPDGLVVVENMVEAGRSEITKVRTAIEPRLIHPAVNGPEIRRFGIEPEIHVLLTQDPATRKPYPLEWMETQAPMTLAYLRPFEKILLARGSKPIAELARKTQFYAMFGVGEYSVAPWRVAWARTTKHMGAAVLSQMRTAVGRKAIIACDHATFIATDDRMEAHYICAILNSTFVQEFLESACPTAEVGPPSSIEPLAIPKFERTDPLHRALSGLSVDAHRIARRKGDLGPLDAAIDAKVAELWKI
jgi:hypothetical protein